jgi:DNA-binding ferritin-like protein
MTRSPKERFKELAEKRMDKALKAINSVTKLSDRKNYQYDEAQVSQMIEALDAAVEELKNEYSRGIKNRASTFEFK